MPLDSRLLPLLACPCEAHAQLRPVEVIGADSGLACPVCDRVFEVRDGIPVLLLSDAIANNDGATVVDERA